MIFQLLDDKKECVGIYAKGRLHYENLPPEPLTQTWAYSPSIAEKATQCEYAQIYCNGLSLDEVCEGFQGLLSRNDIVSLDVAEMADDGPKGRTMDSTIKTVAALLDLEKEQPRQLFRYWIGDL